MRIHMLLTIFILVCFTACKKEAAKSQKNVDLISKQNWTLTSLRWNTNNGPWVDGLSTVPACQKDNQTTFHSNYTYTLEEGPTKCNSSDPQIFDNGTWSFASNETKLVTSNNGYLYTSVDITLLDESNLQTIKRDTSGSEITVVETNYIH